MKHLIEKVRSMISRFVFVISILLSLVMSSDTVTNSRTFVPGQTVTQLSDGRWLVVGGESPQGPLSSAVIWDPRTDTTIPLPNRLQESRAWHTTTLLSDGNVLILGGVSANGQIVGTAELFDPDSGTFSPILTPATPRAHHTATLLTNGDILIAGGLSNNKELLHTAELWDYKEKIARPLPGNLATARRNHTAALRADGSVLFSGGINQSGRDVIETELYNPESNQFSSINFSKSTQTDPIKPYLVATIPADDATNVLHDSIVSMRFSRPLRIESINTNTVKLSTSQGLVSTKVVLAGDGMLLFLTPKEPLLPATSYKVSLFGLVDRENNFLQFAQFSFRTKNLEVSDARMLDEEEWIPDPTTWRTGRVDTTSNQLPPLMANKGVTALSGRVLKLNGEPLANVTLGISGTIARTDNTGRFLLSLNVHGNLGLHIDGRPANGNGKAYGIFHTGVQIEKGQTNVLPFTIWMPSLDREIRIGSPTRSEVLTNQKIPGLQVHMPRDTIIRGINGRPLTSLSVTPMPLDRTPIPLPTGVQLLALITLQPAEFALEGINGIKSAGIQIVFPNYSKAMPGTRFDLWMHDHHGWMIYGQGTVSADGSHVIPDYGAVIQSDPCGAALGDPSDLGAPGPPPGSCGEDGDPVDCYTGQFLDRNTDLYLPDVIPINLTRVYYSGDNIVRPRPFGKMTTHSYEIKLVGDASTYTYADLILADGGRIRYNRISPGVGYIDAVMEHTTTPTAFYESVLSWNVARGGWDIKFKNGYVYEFFVNYLNKKALLSAIVDRNGNRLSITRDSYYRISQITSPNGKWIKFTYGGVSNSNIIYAQDSAGRIVSYEYNEYGAGPPLKVTDPNGGVTEYTYDSQYRILTIKNPRGYMYVSNEYDANGRVFRQTRADNTTFQFAYTLDGNGKVIQTDVTNPRGYVRRMTFNSDGYILTDTLAVGTSVQQTTTYERQAATNLLSSETDPLGRKTSYTYDFMGNMTGITRLADTPEAVTTTFGYEPLFHQINSITDSLNHTLSISYDTNGSPIVVTDPENNETTSTYNLSGQVLTITDPLDNVTQFDYTSGELTRVTLPSNRVLTRFLDSAGRTVVSTNPNGNSKWYDYDLLNRPTRLVDALGGQTVLSYDANSNLLSITDARNKITFHSYNNMDRLESRTDPLMLSETYLYDGNGNLSRVTDRKNQITNYVYDALDRLSQVQYHDGSTTTYTYDLGNRLTEVVDSISGTISRNFDGLDRLTNETTANGSVSYTYDNGGRRITMTVAGQPTINYNYNNVGQITQISKGSASIVITYDDAGRRESITLSNNIIMEYFYNAASQVSGIVYKQGANVLGNLIYQYDLVGRRTKVQGSFARTNLPSTLASATYNDSNRQMTFGGQTLIYDNNGNLTNDGTKSYTWNVRNQLIGISGSGLNASFQYDALGRRINKLINSVSTSFLYDGINPVQELSGGNPNANLDTGFQADQYFSRTDSSGSRYFLTDSLGSTIALSDSQSSIQTEYSYEPFGSNTVSGASNSNPYRYTGREDDGTGLYYYRARYYHPNLQRFISEDPIRFAGGDINLYSFVSNDPINRLDPSGLAEGHHIVPKQVYKSKDLSKEAYDTFKRTTSGGPLPREIHAWNKEHMAYNEAVDDLFEQFVKKNKIDPSKMTAQQAEEFIQLVKNSRIPAIKNFLLKIAQFLKSIGRGACYSVADIAFALWSDFELLLRAIENDRSFDEEWQAESKIFPFVLTPWGPVENPVYDPYEGVIY